MECVWECDGACVCVWGGDGGKEGMSFGGVADWLAKSLLWLIPIYYFTRYTKV